MARAPNEKLNKALSLYQKGYKLVDIAKELDIPPGTVRRWTKTYNRDNSERSEKENDKSERSVSKKSKENEKKKRKEKAIAEEVKEVLENTELTEKQRLFCIYYIEDYNKTRAYQRAYECSYRVANINGPRLLVNASIKKEIERLTNECLEEKEVNAKLLNKRLFEMYIKIAFADIGDYLKFGQEEQKVWSMNEDGSFKPVIDPETGEQKVRKYNFVNLNESEEVDTTIISEVSEGKDGVKIKLHDKMKALEWLDKHYGQLDKLTSEKLEIEKQKLELAKIKSGAYEEEEEVEDDGFIDALGNKVAEVWADEENSQ